jgi:hypothetical protein
MDRTAFIPSGPQDQRQSSEQTSPPGELNDELVRQVADRVYRLLMQEMKYEMERVRLVSKKSVYRKGGR